MCNFTRCVGRSFRLGLLGAFFLGALAPGCSTTPSPSERERQARFAFNQAMRVHQLPVGDATNAVERATLMDQTASAYAKVEQDYRDVPRWAAAALRCQGQANLERGQVKAALACFDQVGRRYPGEHWEVIQAWKAAADTLWVAHQQSEARLYYRQIVTTYGGKTGHPPMFDTIVTVARSRLKEPGDP